MARTKDAKAKAGKEPEAGKAGKAGKAPKGERPPKAKGALLGRVTNLVAVLFGLSLVAEKVASG